MSIAGCDWGGGGGGNGNLYTDAKIKIHDFSITTPVPSGSTYRTTSDSVGIRGSGLAYRGTVSGCLDVHSLDITWRNGANGTTGEGDAYAHCACYIALCAPDGGWVVNYGLIPLEMGSNRIRVTGTYGSMSKQASITVIREQPVASASVAAIPRRSASYAAPTEALRSDIVGLSDGEGGFVNLHYVTAKDAGADRDTPGFDRMRVMSDLAHLVIPQVYDVVLFYSLADWAGWRELQGPCSVPAANTGFVGNGAMDEICGAIPADWQALRGILVSPLLETGGCQVSENLLQAMNGMGRAWGVYWAFPLSGNGTHSGQVSVADSLAGGPYWIDNSRRLDENQPGLMHSPPRGDRFNTFDLYAMGLMGYEEVQGYQYLVDVDDPTLEPLSVENLIGKLKARDDGAYTGDGRRKPDTDPSAMDLKALVVLVTAGEEKPTEQQRAELTHIAADLPDAWYHATWWRSTLSTEIIPR